MQVRSIAGPLRAAPYIKVMGSLNPPAYAAGLSDMSAGVRVALNHIAASTRLSDTEKRAFVRLLADIDQYAGGDPKLILKVMAMVALAESENPPGKYRAHSQIEIDKMYWEDRMSLSQEEIPGVPIAPISDEALTSVNVMA